MDSFFSGTDDANENNTQFYMVWGKVNTEYPTIAFRYVYDGEGYEVDIDELFEFPMIKSVITTTVKEERVLEYSDDMSESLSGVVKSDESSDSEEEVIYDLYPGPYEQVDYPTDWMSQHKKEIPRRYTYGSYSRYGRTKTHPGQGSLLGGGGKNWNSYNDDYLGYGSNKKAPKTKTYNNYGNYKEDIYGEDNFYVDELTNLTIYPHNITSGAPSVMLERKITDFLREVRKDDAEFYYNLSIEDGVY